jgi:hypothetical protein
LPARVSAGAEDLSPGAGFTGTGARPDLSHATLGGAGAVRLRHQAIDQHARHGRREGGLGGGAAVGRLLHHRHLVLDLDHQDRVARAVDLTQVLHQRREGPRVRDAPRVREGRQRFDGLSGRDLGARKPGRVAFDPAGRIAGHAVLPAAKPQQHRVQVLLPQLRQQPVDRGPVEPTFGGLDLLPGDRHQQGVDVQRRQPRPGRVQRCRRRGRRIPQLAALDQERLAVDHQLSRFVTAQHRHPLGIARGARDAAEGQGQAAGRDGDRDRQGDPDRGAPSGTANPKARLTNREPKNNEPNAKCAACVRHRFQRRQCI